MKKIAQTSYERYLQRLKELDFSYNDHTDQIHQEADAAVQTPLTRKNQIYENNIKITQKKVDDDNAES